MPLYTCFRFSEVMDQMFLAVRDAVQGSFRATLGSPCSCRLTTRMGSLEMPPPPPQPRVISSMLI